MAAVKLKRFLKDKPVAGFLDELANSPGGPFAILDAQGALVFGPEDSPGEAIPIIMDGETIGTVRGAAHSASMVARALSNLAMRERDKQVVVRDALEKYNEITLLCQLIQDYADTAKTETIAQRFIDELMNVVKADSAALLSLHPATSPQLIAFQGNEDRIRLNLAAGKDIYTDVLEKGRAEIVNDTRVDSRFDDGMGKAVSILCSPLKTGGKVHGFAWASSEEPTTYSSQDLNLFVAMASLSGMALHSTRLQAKLHTVEQVLQEQT